MKKITLLGTLLVSTILLGGTVVAFADGEATPLPAGSKATATIEAADETDPETPTDPTDPGQELVPPIDGSASKGPLRMDFVPNLDFGSFKNQSAQIEQPALYNKISALQEDQTTVEKFVKNYVQVTDIRGTKEGWKLSVAGSDLKNTDQGSTNVLTGSKIVISKLDASSINFNGELTTGLDAISPIVAKETVEIELGGTEQALMTAAEGAGYNSWFMTLGAGKVVTGTSASTNENVQLIIPASADKSAADYSADLTWTLTSTPA